MLLIGSKLLNKMLEAGMNSSINGNNLNLGAYTDTSGNKLWSNMTADSAIEYNLSQLVLRYNGNLSKSQTDISGWSYNSPATLKAFGNYTKNDGNCDFVLGSGNTPETYNDYKIESEVLLNLAGKGWYRTSDGKLVLSKTYQNNYDDIVNIREIGFIYICSDSISLGNNHQRNVLCSREVLSEPIILAPNETITVSLMNNTIGLTR